MSSNSDLLAAISTFLLFIATLILVIFTWRLDNESRKLTDATTSLGTHSNNLVSATRQLEETTSAIGRQTIKPSFLLDMCAYNQQARSKIVRIRNTGNGAAKEVTVSAKTEGGQARSVSSELYNGIDAEINGQLAYNI